MFRSMTAYGRAHVMTKEGGFSIEVHSVNRKSLDVTVDLPKELLGFDMKLRKGLSEEVKRGCVTIRVTREDHPKNSKAALPDVESLRLLQRSCYQRARALGYNPEEALPFHVLLKYGMMDCNHSALLVDDELQHQLMGGFKKALSKCVAMREKEGKVLLRDIDSRLSNVEQQLDLIAGKVEMAPARFRNKLENRLKEFQPSEYGSAERVARELVIFSEKVDATEEMIRLRCHIQQFRKLLRSKQRRSGKELNFLIQEMNREVNTVAAKSQDLEITRATLEMKTDQEKIREQIQNIE